MSENPPPQFANYPRPNYQHTPQGRPPGVYFDAITDAWTLVKAELATWMGATALLGAITVVISLLNQLIVYGTLLPPTEETLEQTLQSLGLSLVGGAINYTLFAGLMHMGVKQAQGQQISVGDLFAGFGRIGSMLGVYILNTIILSLGFLFCIVPGIYLAGALAFVYILVIEQQMGPIEAIGKSYETLKPHAWAMFGLLFIVGLLAGLGVCACGVGLLFTIPVYAVAMGLHYTYFYPQVAPDSPAYVPPGYG